MSKVTSESFGNMAFIQRRLDDLFSKGLKQTLKSNLGEPSPAEVYIEGGKRVVAKLDVEGLTKEELIIRIQGNVLEVMAYRIPEINKSNKHSVPSEFPERNFYRQVVLPVKNTKNSFSASLSNGKLRVSVPLKDKKAPKN